MKGALDVALELHLFMHFSMHKSSPNDSIICELQGAQYAALEGTPFFSEAFKISQKGEDKDGGFEVSLGSNLWLHFLVQSLMHKSAPYNSSNGEFDGSL